jgi:hypothetical protein
LVQAVGQKGKVLKSLGTGPKQVSEGPVEAPLL